ncbi:MAG TPA: thioredoxin [Gemmatimonadales bacterium]|nr:thioredoxin [Gemmatimonadales bacterium]
MSTTSATVAVTDDTFATAVEQATGLVLVDFWAEWCGPCKMIAPTLEQLATEYAGKMTIAKLDVDTNQRTSMKFNVRSIPSLLFFKDGKHVDTVVGLVPKAALVERIQKHLG